MTRSKTLVLLASVVFVVLAGCDGGESSPETTTTSSPTTQTPSDTPSTTVQGQPAESTTTSTAPAESVIAGVAQIEQTTPTSGEGTRPLLAWTPVDGAATYIVMVYTESDEPYWSAYTSESSTYVGGPLQIPSERMGPNVAAGYTWSVYAEDAGGVLLAASPLRPIAP